MEQKDYKLKIKLNKASDDNFPKFSLSYKADFNKSQLASYSILSKLIGDKDIVVEIDTNLLSVSKKSSNEDYAKALLENIRVHDLKYIQRKTAAIKRSFFGIQTDNKDNSKADEIVAYIPNSIWNNHLLRDVLPANGIRYHITKEAIKDDNIINEFWNLSKGEKAELFIMTIFDVVQMGQMGIFTNTLEATELKKLLGL